MMPDFKVNRGKIGLPRELARAMYRTLVTIRRFEQKAIQLYRQGLIRGYLHPYLGQEAIAVGVCSALHERDAIISTHRGHGHCIAKGMDLRRMMAELLGKVDGYCHGWGGSMHIADVDSGVLGANGIVGAGIPIAVGAAKGFKIRGTDQVIACFFTDGAANNGTFAESLNLAAIWNLPALFVLENNQYAVSTPITAVSRSRNLADRAKGYGVPAETINGNEVDLVYATAARGIDLCRKREGPFLIECMTYRHSGHHVNDPGSYMPEKELTFWKQENDPLDNWRHRLILSELATEQELSAMDAEVEAELQEAIEFARNSAEPLPEEFLAEVGA